MKKASKHERQRVRLQVIESLDRCRRCHYGNQGITSFCEICPTYELLRKHAGELCPDRSNEYTQKNARIILEKGQLITKNDLAYLIAARVPNRLIADRMDIGVRELNQMIERLGI